jgi:GNAT superfamily N-acetyltransferase
MTNQDILQIALQQSAYDCNCNPEDFLSNENIITISRKHPLARKYIPLPLQCDLVSYGSNVVAQTSEELRPLVEAYLNKYPVEHCFETPHIHALDEMLAPYGLKVCFMAEYFLPDVSRLKETDCGYTLRVFQPEDFQHLYTPQWSNALCENRKELDVLAVGAYDQEKLIGLAGCSADCETMYQIGIDVLPEYRRHGIATALTVRLAREIMKLGKVPFYCAAWCNLKSVKNAIKAGFSPAWVEITARENSLINDMNK